MQIYQSPKEIPASEPPEIPVTPGPTFPDIPAEEPEIKPSPEIPSPEK